MTPAQDGPVKFTVPGRPVPKGSGGFVVSCTTDRPFYKPTRARALAAWSRAAALLARAAMAGRKPFTGPVHVTLSFWLRRPKRPRSDWPDVRPDADKLARAALDAFTGSVFRDDGQVCILIVEKRWSGRNMGEPRLEVSAESMWPAAASRTPAAAGPSQGVQER